MHWYLLRRTSIHRPYIGCVSNLKRGANPLHYRYGFRSGNIVPFLIEPNLVLIPLAVLAGSGELHLNVVFATSLVQNVSQTFVLEP
jgi:hypothetical protein